MHGWHQLALRDVDLLRAAGTGRQPLEIDATGPRRLVRPR
jgi:hypothetical protein